MANTSSIPSSDSDDSAPASGESGDAEMPARHMCLDQLFAQYGGFLFVYYINERGRRRRPRVLACVEKQPRDTRSIYLAHTKHRAHESGQGV